MKFMIHNRFDAIAPLAEQVEAYLAKQRVAPETILTTNLCLEELLTNTIKYGYSDDDVHEISIEFNLQNAEMSIEIVDDADPFDPTSDAPTPEIETPMEERPIGGLGILLVTSFTDSMQYDRRQNHNRLTLRKRLNQNT